ncbi:hypothetical protein DCM91_08885 [Chitinophaga costaii]|nr:hypothetical protein DCM91_08885 [Chitinophaga costaii]
MLLFACQENKAQQEQKEKAKENVEKAGQNLKSAAQNTGDYLAMQKDSVKAALQEQLDKVDKKMGDLKEDGAAKTADTKQKLQHWHDVLSRKIDDVQQSSGDKWEETKTGANLLLTKSNRAWDRIKQGIRETFSDQDSTKKDK